jgi:hypothetical protein
MIATPELVCAANGESCDPDRPNQRCGYVLVRTAGRIFTTQLYFPQPRRGSRLLPRVLSTAGLSLARPELRSERPTACGPGIGAVVIVVRLGPERIGFATESCVLAGIIGSVSDSSAAR